MKNDIYDQLLQDIDKISFGFPRSYIGSDRSLVKKTFSKEDAADFIAMDTGFQTAKEYAQRNNLTEEEALSKLERMANKGVIFRRRRETGDEYRKYPFVLGFLEFQVHNANKAWLMATSLYMISSKFGERMNQTMPFYRTVPMHKEFVEGSIVMPYDDIEAVLNRHTRFAVSQCACRTMYRMKPGNKCKHPLETCIMTDDFATFFIETGAGREITKEETLAILRQGEKDGRVINVSNSKAGENICSCCGCGCGMLYLKTKYKGPSEDVWSNHYAVLDEEKCKHCGLCVKRCPFKYIKQKDGKIIIDTKSCLGCGICVSTCPTKALVLKQKDKLYEPPETYDDAIEVWKKVTKKDYKHYK